jgi:hypothetical protein
LNNHKNFQLSILAPSRKDIGYQVQDAECDAEQIMWKLIAVTHRKIRSGSNLINRMEIQELARREGEVLGEPWQG